jgi:hypothetical protein
MGRIRTIKPEFWTDDKVVECEIPARLLFLGMLNFADDNGNLERSSKKLKMQIYPGDSIDVEPLVHSLITHGLLTEYSLKGRLYLHINGFAKHQRINRPSNGLVPPPSEADNAPVLTEDSLRTHPRKGRERKGVNLKPKPQPKESMAALPPCAREDRPPSPPVKKENEEAEKPDDDPPPIRPNHRAAGIALLLRTNGIEGATPANPHVVEWADNPRITDDVLLAAAAMAKNREGVRRPGPNYLAPIVAQVLDPPKPKPRRDEWDRTDAGISRKARELGVSARAGESYASLKDRVFEAIRRSANGAQPGA